MNAVRGNAMSTAKDKFHKGERVHMTDEAVAQGLMPKNRLRYGTITGWSWSNDALVRVHLDGQAIGQLYHMDFWEALPVQSGGTE